MYIILSIYTKIHILNFYHNFEYILKNIYIQKTPLVKIYVFFIKKNYYFLTYFRPYTK